MFYSFAWRLCRTLLILIRRMRVTGLENIPPQGGLIVVCNHRSYWDPIILGCAIPKERQIFFMAKEELFRVPILKNAIAMAGAFPIKRGSADRNAIRTAINYLKQGKTVGIFPEGTRNKDSGLLEPQIGMAMLSTKAGVPVQPVAIINSGGLFGNITVKIGSAINAVENSTHDVPQKYTRQELVQLSTLIMEQIANLMEMPKSGDL